MTKNPNKKLVLSRETLAQVLGGAADVLPPQSVPGTITTITKTTSTVPTRLPTMCCRQGQGE